MATNLVSQIVEALGPTIVSRIASSLGFDQAVTQKAINAAVPGLLAALISLVSKPQGCSQFQPLVPSSSPRWTRSAPSLAHLGDNLVGRTRRTLVVRVTTEAPRARR